MKDLPHSKSQGCNNYQYSSGLSRRESLKWLGVLSASLVLPSVVGCTSEKSEIISNIAASKGHWPKLNLPAISTAGYGKDPNLITPIRAPWGKTLTTEQLTLVAELSDILIPRDGDVPSASEVNVPDVIDEWVSAPYNRQQNDRLVILSGLQWIDDESQLRFKHTFTQLSHTQQLQIVDDIAYSNRDVPDEFTNIVPAFAAFRKLVLAAFFCSPEGTKDLGYIGNIPIIGDYPGPTDEAMAHLNLTLQELGL
jgi:hypothetical protein